MLVLLVLKSRAGKASLKVGASAASTGGGQGLSRLPQGRRTVSQERQKSHFPNGEYGAGPGSGS